MGHRLRKNGLFVSKKRDTERNKKEKRVTWRRSLWMNWMEAEEPPTAEPPGSKETPVLRLAKTLAGSLDDNGETFGVDSEALDFFLEEEARAVAA